MPENLKAIKSFTYGGRALKAGDEFTASGADSRVLRAVGRATPAGVYVTTEAQPQVTKAQPKPPAKKAASKKANHEGDIK